MGHREFRIRSSGITNWSTVRRENLYRKNESGLEDESEESLSKLRTRTNQGKQTKKRQLRVMKDQLYECHSMMSDSLMAMT